MAKIRAKHRELQERVKRERCTVIYHLTRSAHHQSKSPRSRGSDYDVILSRGIKHRNLRLRFLLPRPSRVASLFRRDARGVEREGGGGMARPGKNARTRFITTIVRGNGGGKGDAAAAAAAGQLSRTNELEHARRITDNANSNLNHEQYRCDWLISSYPKSVSCLRRLGRRSARVAYAAAKMESPARRVPFSTCTWNSTAPSISLLVIAHN